MDHDRPGEAAAPTARVGLGGRLTALVSYALFAVGIAALASFFAPFIGAPTLGVIDALPVIAAPTEQDTVINATPLIIGVVASGVAVRIR